MSLLEKVRGKGTALFYLCVPFMTLMANTED